MDNSRRILGILLLAQIGTGVELLLLEHTEDLWQQLPIGLLAGSCSLVIWNSRFGGRISTRVLQGFMLLVAVSGVVGVCLHYQGNVEFEQEMYESLTGLDLFWKAIHGATPVLAPGAMIVCGLLGLVYAGLRSRSASSDTSS